MNLVIISFFNVSMQLIFGQEYSNAPLAIRGTYEWHTEVKCLSCHWKKECFINTVKKLALEAVVYYIWKEIRYYVA